MTDQTMSILEAAKMLRQHLGLFCSNSDSIAAAIFAAANKAIAAAETINEFQRGLEAAARYMENKAGEIGYDTPTSCMMARIFEDQAAEILKITH